MNPLIQYSHNSIHDVVYRRDNSFGTDTWIPLLDILLERKFVWFHNLHKISLHTLYGGDINFMWGLGKTKISYYPHKVSPPWEE